MEPKIYKSYKNEFDSIYIYISDGRYFESIDISDGRYYRYLGIPVLYSIFIEKKYRCQGARVYLRPVPKGSVSIDI